MSADDSVTQWIAKLGAGNVAAAQAIWNRYFERLAYYARRKLNKVPRRVADEEDIALSALDSFCRGAAAGRFPRLTDRHDLWGLLITIATRKVYAQMRRQRAGKRGGGKVRGESVFLPVNGESGLTCIGEMMSREPTPEAVNMVAENCQRLLDALGDDTLRQVALLKLEGFTSDEIAAKLDCVTRTVERKLERIRLKWEKEPTVDSNSD